MLPPRVVIALVLGALVAAPSPAAAQWSEDPVGRRLLTAMTPAQRVGQLFLVPFHGSDLDEDAAIVGLITEGHVGGVVLDPVRGNFVNESEAPLEIATLANGLQELAGPSTPFVPLFVALAQKGDAYPGSPWSGGATPLPSAMALGATWDTAHAERIGDIVGRELAAVGINLLFGPDLDVVLSPQPGGAGDLGVRSFGGSPQWVGRLGSRFIEGVHAGSRGRVATAAGHFPGIGSADRSPDEEVAVIEKPFQQLSTTDLAPFAMAASSLRPGAETDALVTSHVRYRGIQQQLDRPLSLDIGGFRYLWAQEPPLAEWRDAGGVLVSPGIGLPAVRRYDDPNLRSFNHRRVLREALVAGHDVLLVEGFGTPGAPALEAAAIADGLEWLTGVYQEDEAVRDAVDEAVLRIIALKRRLYPELSPAEVMVNAGAAAVRSGVGTEDVRAVAREALTRISPPTTAGAAGSPRVGEKVLLVVDARSVQVCQECAPTSSLDPERLVAIARRTYGRDGAHRVEDQDLEAITFVELKGWLQATGAVEGDDTVALVAPLSEERLSRVATLVAEADWLVFAMRDVRPSEAPGSDALKLFLKASPPERSGQRLVALAFEAPYYLDTTEIAKLTAYYAVYARTEPFVEVAIRALFGDEPAPGASPVSVPGAGYDLFRSLEPALAGVTLEVVGSDANRAVEIGSELTVRTSAIIDANGHQVPDGTPVTFRRFARTEGLYLPDAEVTTAGGHAVATMRVERPGELEVRAVFANGLLSEPLVVAVEGRRLAAIEPEDGPRLAAVERPAVDWGILVLSLGGILIAGAVVYAVDPGAGREPSRLVRLSLISLCLGLAGYLLVAAGGVQLDRLADARFWPAEWGRAYQAPVLSLLFALLAVIPTVAQSLQRLGGARRGLADASLPGGENGQQQEQSRDGE